MTALKEREVSETSGETPQKHESVYYCGQHGVMNKATDLKNKVDQITEKA
jgi:hypothetical protein